MKVLITGAKGFIGQNLVQHLSERRGIELVHFTREHSVAQLPELLHGVDFVFHLAGVNRPQVPADFKTGNTDLTHSLCRALADVAVNTGKRVPVVYTSSSQAKQANPYGVSKQGAESALFALQREHQVPVYVFRLPNVFGKWARPHYNSVVATFCHNVARGLPIQVNDPAAALTLVYIDDVVKRFVQLLEQSDGATDASGFVSVAPQYTTTVGELAAQIQAFDGCRSSLMSERVGTGLVRALYATYVSFLPNERFAYDVPQHADPRGVFVEMLKTPDSGQFSYFTAHPGITRGGHYHHTKTEKFLVIKGTGLFRFRHLQTDERFELTTTGDKPQVVDTIPGWVHDITNVGSDELVVMLWANEVFDRANPDTVAAKV